MTTAPTPDPAPVPDPAPLGVPPLPPSMSNLPPELEPLIGQVESVVGIKPGQQTTEFWIAVGTAIVNTGAAIGMLWAKRVSPDAAMTMLTTGNGGIAGLYTLARTWLKVKAATAAPAPLPNVTNVTNVLPPHQ